MALGGSFPARDSRTWESSDDTIMFGPAPQRQRRRVFAANNSAAILNSPGCSVGCRFSLDGLAMTCTALHGSPTAFVTSADICATAFSFLSKDYVRSVTISTPQYPLHGLSPSALALVPSLFPRITHLGVTGEFLWNDVLATARAIPSGQLTSLSIACPQGGFQFDANTLSWLASSLLQLDMDGSELQEVPTSIAPLVNLRSLSLSHNRITALSVERFAQLTSLEELCLGSNAICALPPGLFYSMTLLKTLDMSDNELVELPANTFEYHNRIAELSFRSNHITELPADVFKHMPDLLLISLGFNKLRSLPPSLFASNVWLNEVSLSDNNITEIPEGLFDYNPHITLLSFRENFITALPPTVFQNIPKLTYLSFGQNPITELPEDMFANLPELRALMFGDTKIAWLPGRIFRNQAKLQALRIDDNQLLGNLSEVLLPLRSLHSLNVSHNPALVSVGQPWALRSMSLLDISNTGIPLDASMCQPGLTLNIRHMSSESPDALAVMMSTCMSIVDVMDISDNRLLSNVTFLQLTLATFSVALPIR